MFLNEASNLDESTKNAIAKGEISNVIDSAFANQDFKLLKSIITSVHYADLADYIDFANKEERSKIIELLGDKFNPEMLTEFSVDVLRSIMGIVGQKKFATILSKLDPDEAIELLDDLSEDEKAEIFIRVSPGFRKILKAGLNYPKNSAGILMQNNFLAVRASEHVGEVLKQIANSSKLPDNFDEVFVVDKDSQPIGTVHISKLIRNKSSVIAEKIMNDQIQPIPVDMDQEDVSYIFRHYDLSAAPVVNKNGKMVGVIHIDQIVDVVEEEAEEDIMKLGGVKILDIYSAFFKTATQRFPWLFFNLLTACFTSYMISMFGTTIEKMVILAAIMPIVASTGGNAGTQTVTVAVRAIANKDITLSNATQVIFKEIASCALNGLLLGLLGGIILLFIYDSFDISLIFTLAVLINFAIAGCLGSLIPITLSRLGADPAIASSVLLTFLTDIVGFCLFLGMASLVI